MDYPEFFILGYSEQTEENHRQNQKAHKQDQNFSPLEHAERYPPVFHILQLQHTFYEYNAFRSFQMRDGQIFCKLVHKQEGQHNYHVQNYLLCFFSVMHGHPLH